MTSINTRTLINTGIWTKGECDEPKQNKRTYNNNNNNEQRRPRPRQQQIQEKKLQKKKTRHKLGNGNEREHNMLLIRAEIAGQAPYITITSNHSTPSHTQHTTTIHSINCITAILVASPFSLSSVPYSLPFGLRSYVLCVCL